MKMKSTLSLAFFMLVSICFYVHTAVQKQQLDHPTEHLTDVLTQTPTQVGALTLKNFFQKNYDFLSSRNKTIIQQTEHQKSKISLFNQSLNRYISEIYNNENYADQLSRDGAHFIEFLRIGNELNLDIESIYTCQRLLFNKIKGCEIIDDTVVNQILIPFAELVEPYFVPRADHEWDADYFIKEVDALILHKFTNHLPTFQQTPDKFITELAGEIIHSTHDKMISKLKNDSTETVQRFRFLIKQTIEILIEKMMWNPHAYQSLKPSFISIGNSILQLAEKKVFNHMDDLDDLITSLNTRFCFFFKVYGSVIPTDAIDELLESLKNQEIFFLELEEQDPGILSKKELLTRQLTRAKVKAIARSKGLQTDQVI